MTAGLLTLVRWLAQGALIGCLTGLSSAIFLYALERVTKLRLEHRALVFAMPLGGALVGLLYDRYGAPIREGTNLVVRALRDDRVEVPTRMAPMVLTGTLATHLVGGSAGREGTAVQMGASLAARVADELGMAPSSRRILLRAGVAGGFGGVFGTPIAGTVFALELARRDRVEAQALLPSLSAALVADAVVHGLGTNHGAYPLVAEIELRPGVLLAWLAFATAVALVVAAFLWLTHAVKRVSERLSSKRSLRLALGGLAVATVATVTRAEDLLGLSEPVLERALVDPTLPTATFAAKLALTALTLGAGFIGGEVTPLFVIGAALGNALAAPLGLPLTLAAMVGLVATFGAAAGTPFALAFMAAELGGAALLPHALLVTTAASAMLGETTLYSARLDPEPTSTVHHAQGHERDARETAAEDDARRSDAKPNQQDAGCRTERERDRVDE